MRFATLAIIFCLVVASPLIAAEPWRAGAARANITPREYMWMSGYAARTRPAEGKRTDLWAKCLVLEDNEGHRAALITLDLVGIPRVLSLGIREAIEKKHGLRRDQVAINCSHTHCGPVVGHNLGTMYFLDDDQQQRVAVYGAELERQIVDVVGQAVAALAPAKVAWGTGKCGFAVNRRNNNQLEVAKLREVGALVGPVDHDVPVLTVRDLEGRLRAMTFGYACHATCLDFYEWCGDYPGFAMLALEARHPEAVAMYWAGCGADQNPLPRRTVEIAEAYGRRLADAVEDVVGAPMTPLEGGIATHYREIPLALGTLPTRDELLNQTESKNRYEASRAKHLLAQLDAGNPLAQTYPYPVQLWQLGPELRFVTLGGEVTVGYALRLKRELGPAMTWVAGYSNDVMAYIPTLTVLKEGGYEGATAMIYYGLPTAWSTQVEEDIVAAVHALAH